MIALHLFAFGKTFDEVTRKLQNDFLILDESSELVGFPTEN